MSIDSRDGRYYPVCDYCGIELEGKGTFKEAVQEAEEAGWYYERKEELVEIEATLIPYYAFANRGAMEMQVWHFVK